MRPWRRPAPGHLREFSWNCKVGRRPRVVRDELEDFIDRRRPDVIYLQEAGGYIRQLRKIKGYRLYAKHGWAESANCPILVRKGIPVPRWGVLRMTHSWTGPKAGKRHPGRTFTWVDLGRGRKGRRRRRVNVHMPSGGPSGGVRTNNETAYHESIETLAAFADRRGSKVRELGMVGDWNAFLTGPDERHSYSPVALADDIGADVIKAGGGVDYMLIRGARRARGRRAGKKGSDHPARFFKTVHKEAA